MVVPLFEDTPDAVVKSGELGGHLSGSINSGVSLCSNVPVSNAQWDLHIGRQCVVSLTSTLRHQKRDVRDM